MNAAALRSHTLADMVREFTTMFESAALPRPRSEARDLVAAVLRRPRFWATLHGDDAPDEMEVAQLYRAAGRRAAGAPFAYAVGHASFRHLTLHVDERVLIPRPETELLVEIVLSASRPGGEVADVGTGSGAIALALASEGRASRVVGTDVSADALEVARENARLVGGSLRVRPEFRLGAALAPLRGERFDTIVSNPPYIAADEVAALPGSVRDWEPALALSCTADGLGLSRQLIVGAGDCLRPGGTLALEVDCRRAARVAACMSEAGTWRDVTVHRDLTGRDRFVVARHRGPE